MKNNYKSKIAGYSLLVFLVLSTLFLAYSFSLNNKTNNTNYGNKIIYNAYFKINGATYLESTKLSCEVINGKCLITMPNAKRDNGSVLGYNTNEKSHEVLHNIYDQINLTSDTTFYVISSETLKLNIYDSELDYVSNYKNSCMSYNEETSCKVKLPFYNKNGYEVRGFSTNPTSLSGYIYPNDYFEIRNNTTIYPIYGTLTRGKIINVNSTKFVNKMIIDIEEGCYGNIYNTYLNYFHKISDKAPYLAVGSKITLLTDTSFDSIWGESYVGMNYGPKNLRMIDVRCSNSVINNYYATIIHEMAHTWDFYYGSVMKKDISEQSEIINLYSKYKNMDNRPFREYSYSNIREFVADMIRYYYLKYVDAMVGYKDLNYPNDIKSVLEKFICIAKNNYDDKVC